MTSFYRERRESPLLNWTTESINSCAEQLASEYCNDKKLSVLIFLNGILLEKKRKYEAADSILAANMLPLLIPLVQIDNDQYIRSEAIKVLGHIASGTNVHTTKVVDANIIPILIQTLVPSSTLLIDTCDYTAWALGIISGKSIHYRDAIVDNHGFQALISIAHQISPENRRFSLARMVGFALSTFYGKKPYLDTTYLPAVVATLSHLLNLSDAETSIIACRTVQNIAMGPVIPHIDALLDTQTPLPSQLIALLSPSTSIKLQSAALKAIGTILTGNKDHTTIVLHLDLLSILPMFLLHEKKSLRKEAAWLLSNITADKDHIQAVIDANLIPTVLGMLTGENDIDVKEETLWILLNVVAEGNHVQVLHLFYLGFLPIVIDFLAIPTYRLIVEILNAINSVLFIAKGANCLELAKDMFREKNGKEKLEACLEHDKEEIFNLARCILEEYFTELGR